jgi:hypothetical protein
MRKSTFILLNTFIFVLFTGWSVALGSWVSFNGGGAPAPPQIQVLGSDGTQTTVHITVPGMVVEEKEVDGQIYQVLRIPDDNATMLNVGEPELPAIRKQVGIPPTCNVSVNIVSQSYTELDGYLVYPFQVPLMEGEEPGPFVIDTVLYGTDSFYPQEIAEVGTPAVWRDVRVTVLSLYPVTFNPVTGVLRVYDDLTVQLNYSGTDGVNPLVNPPPEVSPSFDRMYRRALINYDYLGLDVSDVPLAVFIRQLLKIYVKFYQAASLTYETVSISRSISLSTLSNAFLKDCGYEKGSGLVMARNVGRSTRALSRVKKRHTFRP